MRNLDKLGSTAEYNGKRSYESRDQITYRKDPVPVLPKKNCETQTYLLMQDLKEQLDLKNQPKEVAILQSHLQNADVERRRLETELYQIKRQKIELDSQIQIMSKENKIMK